MPFYHDGNRELQDHFDARRLAESLGWPEKKPGWADLLQQITTGTSLRAGIVEPTRDAAGMSGLLAAHRLRQA